jgi:hypothetical protein
MDTNTQTPQEPAQENSPEIPAVTLQDLMALKGIVEVAANRGTFRAEEMASVGALYDKLAAFLKAVAIPVQPQAENTETPQGE